MSSQLIQHNQMQNLTSPLKSSLHGLIERVSLAQYTTIPALAGRSASSLRHLTQDVCTRPSTCSRDRQVLNLLQVFDDTYSPQNVALVFPVLFTMNSGDQEPDRFQMVITLLGWNIDTVLGNMRF